MIYKYLLHSSENGKKRYFPCHPLSERVFVIDGEFIPAGTEDETEMDKVPSIIDPSVTDKVKHGADLRPMGTPPSQTGLAAARVANDFVATFNALGKRDAQPQPQTEPQPQSQTEPQPQPQSN